MLDTSDYEDNLDDASKKTNNFADKLKKGLATAAKVGTAAIGAASAAVGALTKMSIDGYAEYEQLTGGVETLFKNSADTVMEYANNAYKTAGLSANEYMETVTSFSASLLQSLGGDTEKAAKVADMAITDMADNANKMGTAIDSIQNAYQGFAKQNYTMLDNLKLGYGGTKEEMQRLLSDAEKLSGQKFDLSSYADIVDAIHVVQTEMGITGTTAKEAATTIQGSVAAAKSAWTNLVTGIADENADLDTLIGNFVDSIGTAAENIVPRVTQILSGMGTAIQKLAPVLSEQIPNMISEALPSLIESGVMLVDGLLSGIINALPALAETAPKIILQISEAILNNLPALAEAAVSVISTLADGISDFLPKLIPTIVDVVLQIVDTLTDPDTLSSLIEAALKIMVAIAEGLIDALPKLLEKAPEILLNLGQALLESVPALLEAVADIGEAIVEGIWNGITGAGDWLIDKVKGFFTGIVDGVKDFLGIHSPSLVFASIGENMMLGLGNGIDSGESVVNTKMQDLANIFTSYGEYIQDFFPGYFETALNTVENLSAGLESALSGDFESAGESIINIVEGWETFFEETWENIGNIFSNVAAFIGIGENITNGIKTGISETWNDLTSFVSDSLSSLVDGVKGLLGIHSPSKIFSGIGENMALGLGAGWEDEFSSIKNKIQSGMSFDAGTIDFESSGMFKAGMMISNSIISDPSRENGGDFVINLTEELDGEVLSRKMYRFNQREENRRGPELVMG